MSAISRAQWVTFYTKCWDTLVELAGASAQSSSREAFLFTMLDANDCMEYRFQGNFGFGGKLRRNSNNQGFVHITYYPEDRTAALDVVMDQVNQKLRQLQLAEIGGPIYGPPEKHDQYVSDR